VREPNAQRRMRRTSRPSPSVCGLPVMPTPVRRPSQSRSNLDGGGHLATSRSSLAIDVPCTYHKGARHTLRDCRLWKKIDQECNASRDAQTLTSPDVSEFQKAWIRVSPNDLRSTRWRVLVVSSNEPPWVGVTDSEEARRI
jgi:hypothetical protein